MALAWNWFGLANVLASALLLTLGLLFLKAKRSEFTLAFVAYCVLAAGQKLTGGVALYFAADEPTRAAWLSASTLFLLGSTPALTHALVAFTWPATLRRRGRLVRGVVYGAAAAAVAVALVAPGPFQARAPLATAFVFMAILAVFLVAVGRRALSPTPSAVRTQSRYMLAYLAIALGFSAESRVILLVYGVMPWWELSVAYMAATGILLYGILRTHLFDVDLKVKIAIRQSTIAAVFVAVFFVVSEIAQQWLGETLNSAYVGILAAGALVLALAPIQRIAERIADRAMPHVRESADYFAYRKLEVYRAALELAAEDGVVSARERELLDSLRRKLGIAEPDAAAMERDVLPSAAP